MGFVAGAREINVTPHVTQNINGRRGSNIDAGTTRHPGYAVSQVIRKRIEETNGGIKTISQTEQVPVRGQARTGWTFKFRVAAYNLVRLLGSLATG